MTTDPAPPARPWLTAAVWLVLVAACAAIYTVSDRPVSGGLPVSDKLLHAAAYGFLALLWLAALRLSRPASGWIGLAWIAAACAAVYGATDEWHQSFVAGRTADVWDWVADAAGAAAVAAVVTLWTMRRRRPAA